LKSSDYIIAFEQSDKRNPKSQHLQCSIKTYQDISNLRRDIKNAFSKTLPKPSDDQMKHALKIKEHNNENTLFSYCSKDGQILHKKFTTINEGVINFQSRLFKDRNFSNQIIEYLEEFEPDFKHFYTTSSFQGVITGPSEPREIQIGEVNFQTTSIDGPSWSEYLNYILDLVKTDYKYLLENPNIIFEYFN